jgi:tetratricopeptide (TPR) repeat protein
MTEAAAHVDIYGQSVSLAGEGRHAEAIPLLQRLVEERPDYLDAYDALARSLYACGRYSDAEEICARLAKRLPRDVAVKELWARALQAVDEPKKAAKACRQILAIRPEKESVIARYAEIEADNGKAKRAIRFFRKHIRRHGPTAAALTAMGECCLRIGRIDRAEGYFQRALDLRSDYGPARRGLESLGRSDAVEEAETTYPPGGLLSPPSLEDIRLWLLEGNYLRATRALEERLSRGEGDQESRLVLARCYERAGRIREAIELCEELVGESLNSPDLHCLLGILYWRNGDSEEAVSSLSVATELDPSHIEAHCHMALAYREMGRVEEARTAFQKALELTAQKEGMA